MSATRLPFPPVCPLHGIQTERLRFERLEAQRLESWIPLFNDPDTARFLGLDPTLNRRALAQAWFDKTFSRYAEGSGGQHALIEKGTGTFVGQCGIMIQTWNEEPLLEVGYALLPQFRGRGFAVEAAVRAKQEAFAQHEVDAIHSMVHPENHPSANVAKRNGMTVHASGLHGDMPTDLYRVLRQA